MKAKVAVETGVVAGGAGAAAGAAAGGAGAAVGAAAGGAGAAGAAAGGAGAAVGAAGAVETRAVAGGAGAAAGVGVSATCASMPKRRIVLLGRKGYGKSSAGNTILGEKVFTPRASDNSVKAQCARREKRRYGRKITVIETPGFFDTDNDDKEMKSEIIKALVECAPEVDAFVIVLKVGEYTSQEMKVLQRHLNKINKDVFDHTVILFTFGKQLKGKTIKEFLKANSQLQELVDKCGGRCHVIDNKSWKKRKWGNKSNSAQVKNLLETIDKMRNKNGCFTNELFRKIEEQIQEQIGKMDGENLPQDEKRKKAKKNVQNKMLEQAAKATAETLTGALLGAGIAKMNLNGILSFSSLLHVSSSFIPNTLSSPSLNMSTQHTTNIMTNRNGAIAGVAILGLVFLLGVPGNFFIVWSILARARRRSITTLLILNLAFADGFLMLLTPFFMVYLAQRSWIFGLMLCKVLFYLCCANMYASVFLIMLMSLHRLVAIVWPKRVGALTERRMLRRLLAGLWLLALGLSTPVLVFRTIISSNDNQSLVCDCQHPKPQYEVMQYGMETLLAFLLPYGVIIGSYMCILRRIRKTRFRRRIRSEKLILVIIITFGLFWLPYHIINTVQVAAALHPNSETQTWLKKIRANLRALTSTVAFVSSCINPVLYTFAGKSYIRREGLAFMARLFEGTALETTRRIRRSNQNSRDREKETDEGDSLKDKDSDSTTTANLNSAIKVVAQKNGK
ncbi:leukotriene B4 receptor 1-like protein [Labeo rohita]|nr:leukotriene B4 receptor 1-like protein [Labeo rohita]